MRERKEVEVDRIVGWKRESLILECLGRKVKRLGKVLRVRIKYWIIWMK